ncbi:ABC transporter permease [Cryptosporangium aurantiacum]|uniref:Transport permease protein n=1 Tax=Cryptosporangium aurantiacum TaxID=134849 RepID=A0A1M7RIT6_9ACTN|nr:ABC transporter permease [Cryptosporangium aurantiacum]SHN46235.1 ABC-2 type transport system permease protein [Cryptosporangium aurantiacum]
MTTATHTAPLPTTLRIGVARGVLEVKQFFRERDAVIFTFTLPAFILLMLGFIFNEPLDGYPGVTVSQIFAASMIAYGILSTAFLNIGVGIATDREDGTLKRLHGTPATAGTYLIGKIILVLVTTAAEVVLLLGVGVAFFDLKLPQDAGRWVTFGWLFVLSVVACTLLGVAASSVARSAKSAAAVLNLPVIGLQFVSGIFVDIASLPDAMVKVASIFPVKWMGQGFRSVFLPDELAAQEVAGQWEHGRIALVLGAWCVVGLVLALATFRWTDRRTR